jgi:CheY-like chemotaxis protein
MPHRKVLVVEDDRYGSEVVTRMLEFRQMAVDVAESGEQALHLLESNQYTMAILDLALPGMDGWAVLEAIQQSPIVGMPCVAITAFHDANVARAALEAGFVAYFPKPLRTNFGQEIEAICDEYQ